jgi:hypothetical protein
MTVMQEELSGRVANIDHARGIAVKIRVRIKKDRSATYVGTH